MRWLVSSDDQVAFGAGVYWHGTVHKRFKVRWAFLIFIGPWFVGLGKKER